MHNFKMLVMLLLNAQHDAYCGDECEFGQILGMPARFKAPEDLVNLALGLNHGELKIKKGLTVSGEMVCRQPRKDEANHG